MKGAMNNSDHLFIQNINQNLFMNSQYKFNSGGDPIHITELQYEDLLTYHKKYYNP